MKKINKIQCISNGYGFYGELKLGKWYEFLEEGEDTYCISVRPGPFDISIFPKYLFRTLQEKRDSIINKII